MATSQSITSIETVITPNPRIATFPRLAATCDKCLAAFQGGYAPDPALLTGMFAVLVEISSAGALAASLADLLTEIVEQVILRDTGLATNTELARMLDYYAERLASGYEPDETTSGAILDILSGLPAGNGALQELLDAVTGGLAPSNLTFGFRPTGLGTSFEAGQSVAAAGDVNGDGIDDILVGADGAQGRTFVIFGTADPFAPRLNVGSLDSTNGFTLLGGAFGGSGYSLSSAGDFNGDGFDDILIGAPQASVDGAYFAGRAYLVFGSGDFGATLDVSDLTGANGFAMNGAGTFAWTGFSIASAGDINGDGFDDILVAAPSADDHLGRIYVVLGSDQPFDATLDLASLDGSDSFVLTGANAGDSTGGSVSSAGDPNDDGFDDLLTGVPAADPGGVVFAGGTYIVSGGVDALDRFDLADATKDGVIHLANLGRNPADYDPLC